jgi:hypothetical protein
MRFFFIFILLFTVSVLAWHYIAPEKCQWLSLSDAWQALHYAICGAAGFFLYDSLDNK